MDFRIRAKVGQAITTTRLTINYNYYYCLTDEPVEDAPLPRSPLPPLRVAVVAGVLVALLAVPEPVRPHPTHNTCKLLRGKNRHTVEKYPLNYYINQRRGKCSLKTDFPSLSPANLQSVHPPSLLTHTLFKL